MSHLTHEKHGQFKLYMNICTCSGETESLIYVEGRRGALGGLCADTFLY